MRGASLAWLRTDLEKVRILHYFLAATRSRQDRAMSRAVVEEICTITAKGQTTVPRAVRQALGVGYGGRIAFRVKEGRVTVHALPEDEHAGSGARALPGAAGGPTWPPGRPRPCSPSRRLWCAVLRRWRPRWARWTRILPSRAR